MTTKEPLPYQFFEQILPPQLEVFGGPDFFPAELCDELVVLSNDLGERKVQFDFTYPSVSEDDAPDPIRAAASWSDSLKAPVNTAVLKRYDTADTYQSAAYQPHQDPVVFGTQRLVLVSLSGIAELSVTTSSGEDVTLPCFPGTALFIAPHLLHGVTEPLNPSGVRHFLFMGYRETSMYVPGLT